MAWVFVESKTWPTLNAHGFFKYELEFDLYNSYIPIEKELEVWLMKD